MNVGSHARMHQHPMNVQSDDSSSASLSNSRATLTTPGPTVITPNTGIFNPSFEWDAYPFYSPDVLQEQGGQEQSVSPSYKSSHTPTTLSNSQHRYFPPILSDQLYWI